MQAFNLNIPSRLANLLNNSSSQQLSLQSIVASPGLGLVSFESRWSLRTETLGRQSPLELSSSEQTGLLPISPFRALRGRQLSSLAPDERSEQTDRLAALIDCRPFVGSDDGATARLHHHIRIHGVSCEILFIKEQRRGLLWPHPANQELRVSAARLTR